MLILISDAFDDVLPKRLAAYGEVTADKGRLADAEVVLVRSKTKCTKEYLDQAPNLKLVIRGGVGLDNIDVPYAKSKGIQVENTADASTIAVAELAFAMMIALPNRLVLADTSMREGKWLKKELERTELYGKTLGVLGVGRIGCAVAMRAKAFGMKILGWHPDGRCLDWAEVKSDLSEVLANSDYVSMHMPLTPETKGLINRGTLAKFKDGAYLVNTARGKIVVEEDVVEALKSGKLGGYATDVWYSDPPESTPLLTAPNTLLAPHIGASSVENMARIGEIAESLVREYAAKSR